MKTTWSLYTFDFEPKFVFIISNSEAKASTMNELVYVGQTNSGGKNGIVFNFSGRTLSWYCPTAESGAHAIQLQCNITEEIYNWTAIG